MKDGSSSLKNNLLDIGHEILGLATAVSRPKWLNMEEVTREAKELLFGILGNMPMRKYKGHSEMELKNMNR